RRQARRRQHRELGEQGSGSRFCRRRPALFGAGACGEGVHRFPCRAGEQGGLQDKGPGAGELTGSSFARSVAMAPRLPVLVAAFIGVLSFGSAFGLAQAAEIKVLSAGALRSLLQELKPDFEKNSGNRLVLDFATAGGVDDRIASGDAVDVALLTEPRIKKLEGDGKIARDSIALIGLVVKKGAPRPDISSVDAFRRALLAATSIGFTDPASGGTSGIHIAKVFEQLGIAGELKPKLRPIAGSAGHPPSVGGAVALG